MINVKKIILLLAVSIFTLAASAQSEYILIQTGSENHKSSFRDGTSLVPSSGQWNLKTDGESVSLDRLKKITFETYKCGDANLDNNVDVADITSVASFILGRTPSDFLKDAADANEDKNIDVADITAIASKILNNAKVEKVK